MGALVNRDYDEIVADFGDVVNTSRPADFTGLRKVDSDSVTEQDAVSANIPVPLDQHFHVTFVIKDGEMSKALPNLIDKYLEPAARELAESVDRVLCGQIVRLRDESEEGRLLEMSSSNADEFVLDANAALDIARCPKAGRNLVLGPRAQKECLKADLFVSAEKRGDEGTALRMASLGTVYGLDSFMDQNMGYVALTNAQYTSGVTDNAEAIGATLIETTVVDSADITAGCYIWFEGEGQPHRVDSKANDPVDFTLTEGLRYAVGAGADAIVFRQGEVNLVAGYAAGWSKLIVVDGHTANYGPQVGQWVTFGTGAASHSYTIIASTVVSTTENQILLDRPLETAIVNNEAVFYGPAGGFSLAFHRDAVALVSRPLATVPNAMGARSFVASYNGLAMRVTMQYDSSVQGMRVTFDLLCGVAVLDDRLACPLYS